MRDFLTAPETGKYAHAILTFTGGLLTVVIPAFISLENGPQPLIPLSAGVLLLVTTALNYALSQLREPGKL